MATTKDSGPSVTYQVDSQSGQHSLGVKLDGVFVPFVSLEGHYVKSLVEAGHSPEAQEANGTTSGGDE